MLRYASSLVVLSPYCVSLRRLSFIFNQVARLLAFSHSFVHNFTGVGIAEERALRRRYFAGAQPCRNLLIHIHFHNWEPAPSRAPSLAKSPRFNTSLSQYRATRLYLTLSLSFLTPKLPSPPSSSLNEDARGRWGHEAVRLVGEATD